MAICLVAGSLVYAWWISPKLVEFLLAKQLKTGGIILSKFSMNRPSQWLIEITHIEVESPEFNGLIRGVQIQPLSLTGFDVALEIESATLVGITPAIEIAPKLIWHELIEITDEAKTRLPSHGRINSLELCMPQCVRSQVNWHHQPAHLDIDLDIEWDVEWDVNSDDDPNDKTELEMFVQDMNVSVISTPAHSRIEITTKGSSQLQFKGEMRTTEQEIVFEADGDTSMIAQPLRLNADTPVDYDMTLHSVALAMKWKIPLDTIVSLDSFMHSVHGSLELTSELAWQVDKAPSSLSSQAPLGLMLRIQSGVAEMELLNDIVIDLKNPSVEQGVIKLPAGSSCVLKYPDFIDDVRCTSFVASVTGDLEEYGVVANLEGIKIALINENITFQAAAEIRVADGDTPVLDGIFELRGINSQLTISTDAAMIIGVKKATIHFVHDTETKKGETTFRIESALKDTTRWQKILDIPELKVNQGEITVVAAFTWDSDKQYLAFSSDIEMRDMDLEYDGYLFESGSLKMILSGWPKIRSKEPAEMSWRQLDFGVAVDDIQMAFDLELEPLADSFRISGRRLTGRIFGGTFSSQDYHYDAAISKGQLNIIVENLALNEILALEQEDFVSTGRLSGSVPVQINEGKLSVSKGLLSAVHPGGQLQYQPGPSVIELLRGNESLKVVVDAMSDFHYHALDVDLEYSPDGELVAETTLKGSNPDFEDGREVNLNLNLEENVGALLESLRSTDNVTGKIKKNAKGGVIR